MLVKEVCFLFGFVDLILIYIISLALKNLRLTASMPEISNPGYRLRSLMSEHLRDIRRIRIRFPA